MKVLILMQLGSPQVVYIVNDDFKVSKEILEMAKNNGAELCLMRGHHLQTTADIIEDIEAIFGDGQREEEDE